MLIQELDVYKKAHLLTLQIYNVTGTYPASELYGLTSQMRRAAVSINSNLMEGGARRNMGEKLHFISIARGSAAELEYQIILSKDLRFLADNIANDLIQKTKQVGQMLSGLLKNKNSSDE